VAVRRGCGRFGEGAEEGEGEAIRRSARLRSAFSQTGPGLGSLSTKRQKLKAPGRKNARPAARPISFDVLSNSECKVRGRLAEVL
jgi:hypothetical protein